MIESVLVYIVRELNSYRQVSLVLKKVGYYEGLYGGYEGLINDGEDLQSCCSRIIEEESGQIIKTDKLKKVAELEFTQVDNLLKKHIFLYAEPVEDLLETGNSRPLWFNTDDLPFEDMVSTDEEWLPRILKGEKIKGKIQTNSQGLLDKSDYTVVDSFEN